MGTEVDGVRRAFGLVGAGRMPPHITLAGPVNVRGDELELVMERLRDAAATSVALRLTCGPTARFDTGEVVYLTVSGSDLERLHELRARIHVAPLVRDSRPFVAHVTVHDRGPHTDAVHAATQRWIFDMRCTAISVFEEVMNTDNRAWVLIDDFPFARAAVVGVGGLALTMHTHRQDGMLTVDASRDKRRVGRATVWLAGQRLLSIEVHEALRGEGIGRHLLDRIVYESRLAGCAHLSADAHPFLASLGWTDRHSAEMVRRW